ncbi:LytR/AlgR family response regulator transcription factor [Sphingobacterium paludis]|uniref:LytTR family two component transcriptional regulator n=1 Tax=Sphingobacterium paludis TaxID=1476465 RepID=A0A4R7CUV0_9SPHI|nr:LytTR family DNA-binding domain-containing protein [Sphingobacterium paludis]TDS12159.1 LytTR family two component transcriptional regulator [Sphingobacterium paludis]
MIKCIVIDNEKLAIEMITSCIEKIHDLEILGVFHNFLDAMPIISSGKVDVIFCEIQMPDINGVSFLKSINNPPLFIFVTGDPGHAIESFELGVLDYIMKPLEIDRLLKSVNKVRAFLEPEKSSAFERNFLVIRDRSANVIIPYIELYFIRSDKDYVKIFTVEKTYTVWKKISELEETLAYAKQFLRVQKSYIVNLDHAKTVEGNLIKMKGSVENIPIGGQYKPELYKRLGISGID